MSPINIKFENFFLSFIEEKFPLSNLLFKFMDLLNITKCKFSVHYLQNYACQVKKTYRTWGVDTTLGLQPNWFDP